MITFLGGKGQNPVARSIRADKYIASPFPPAPMRPKVVKSESTDVDVKSEDDVDAASLAIYESRKDKYQAQVKIWANETKNLSDGKYYAVEVALAQCTNPMREALKLSDKYDDVVGDGDILALLKIIQTCSLSHKGRGYQVKNTILDVKRIFSCYQAEGESNQDYRDRLETSILRAEQHGFNISKAFTFKNDDDEDMSEKETKARVTAAILVMNACNLRYKNYKISLHNESIGDGNCYPASWAEAMTGLDEYIDPLASLSIDPHTGSSFNQQRANLVPGKDGKTIPVRCFHCNKFGHKANNCPEKAEDESDGSDNNTKPSGDEKKKGGDKEHEGTNLGQWADGDEFDENEIYDEADEELYGSMEVMIGGAKGVCFVSTKTKTITFVILRDTGSTHHVFCNKELLKAIKATSRPLVMDTNGGKFECQSKGIFPGVGPVWYNPSGIVNVLSASLLRKSGKFETSYHESSTGSYYLLKSKASGKSLRFDEKDGVYTHTTEVEPVKSSINDKTKVNQYSLASLKTVESNEMLFTPRERLYAKRAGQLMKSMAFPSKADMISMLTAGLIKNCPVSVDDVRNYFYIHGGLEGAIKGKTVTRRPTAVREDLGVIVIPKDILAHRKNVTLCVDIFFVDRKPFFTSISKKIMFSTAEALPNRLKNTVMGAAGRTISFYKMYGYKVKLVVADNEFGAIRDQLMESKGVELALAAPDEHVREVERNIRVIKERIRSVLADMPYDLLPANFKRELILICVVLLNLVPRKAGLSKVISPWTIITSRALDYKKHCRAKPGSYCLVHDEKKPRNSMKPRAAGAIAIGPCVNLHGAYKFLYLDTGRIVTRRSFNVLPITPEVEARVAELARGSSAHVEFEYNGTTYSTEDPPEDIDLAELEVDEIDEPPEDDDDETVEAQDQETPDEDNPTASDDEEIGQEDDDDDDDGAGNDGPKITITDTAGPARSTRSSNSSSTFYRLDDTSKAISAAQLTKVRPDQQYKADYEVGANYFQHSYAGKLGKCFNQLAMERNFKSFATEKLRLSCNQMSLEAGLNAHGKAAEKAVEKEFVQFHEKDVLRPRYAYALSMLEKQESLRLIMTVKEKRSGELKGRGCADGRKLRKRISNQDATSPTVTREALMMSCAIDAKEGRVVMTCDVPGAYLHCDMDELCHVLLEGVLVDLYLNVNPAAKDMVTYSRTGKKRLYTRMNKALYGHMRSGRLFWENISSKLQSLGFESNPDDLCVMNKMVGDDQFTIVLHVDDLKLSFANAEGIEEVLAELESEYGKLDIQRGKVLEYLGLTLDYSTDGVCKIGAKSYIDKALENYEKPIKGKAKTPAAENLFVVRDDAVPLEEGERKKFHSVFALTLWLGSMARPDILVALSFLGKRTTKADEDDRSKLERLLSYLKRTRELVLTLGVDTMNVIKWWADSAFAVHPDMRSHSGLIGSLGRGAVFARSTTQKLNTTSSTEAEIVASSEILSQAIWTQSFLRNQGYKVKNGLLYQDNQAAMLIQNHGVLSRRRRSRHIDIRFFFIKDRIDKGEMEIAFCGTNEMTADYLTKPLQGEKFRGFRNEILGLDGETPI
jgi:hypothetical protein